MLRFAVALSSSAMVAQCSFLLPSGPGCLLRGKRRSCLVSAGSSVSPALGGGVAGSVGVCGCVLILKSLCSRGRSCGFVVYLGDAVIVAVARPVSPCCVSFSTRAASFVSSGGRLCGVSDGRSSVSSVSQAPLQKRWSR